MCEKCRSLKIHFGRWCKDCWEKKSEAEQWREMVLTYLRHNTAGGSKRIASCCNPELHYRRDGISIPCTCPHHFIMDQLEAAGVVIELK